MFRQSLIALGSKPARRVANLPFLHASERPAARVNIDFSSLNLKYPVQNNVQFQLPRIGWSPKTEGSTPAHLPFAVERTETGMALPVYTDFKGGRTKVVTIIRKIKGDVNELKAELEKVVCADITVRPGKLIIDGNYHKRVKLYLTALGF